MTFANYLEPLNNHLREDWVMDSDLVEVEVEVEVKVVAEGYCLEVWVLLEEVGKAGCFS